MTERDEFQRMIHARLEELGVRMNAIETELDQPKSKDLGEQAIDLEDDEVLETLGLAAQREVYALRNALRRLADGTYGICATCETEISRERLNLIPQTQLCRSCAQEATAR